MILSGNFLQTWRKLEVYILFNDTYNEVICELTLAVFQILER
jgi:hypothetical protein